MSQKNPTTFRVWLATFALATLTSTLVLVLPQKFAWLLEKPQTEAQGIQELDWSDW